MGEPIAAEIAQTNNIVKHTRRLFLCFAYFIGCVTAIYLKKKNIEGINKYILT